MKSKNSNSSIVSIISEHTTFGEEGIKTKNDIRVNGKVKGKIESSGVLIIGENAIIEGDILAKKIDIAGKVKSDNITSETSVTLRTGSEITAEILTKNIIIEEGALFNGTCSMKKEKVK